MHNARLRGWQRITTKFKHNSRNHRCSMGLNTPRVGSPIEAFVMFNFSVARSSQKTDLKHLPRLVRSGLYKMVEHSHIVVLHTRHLYPHPKSFSFAR
ncbi:hypothetical protein CGT72_19525 [Vibrio cholerae]|nr:hypothetical protein CGT81_06510 [Vibrio cholerae]PAS26011.1 hypothetical protein CGT72_19525 [Vibrio cholerae]